VVWIAVPVSCVTDRVRAQTAPSVREVAAYAGLHAAAWQGDLQQVKRLLADGADPEVRDPVGRTPLHVAAFASHDAIVQALLEAGADPNALENDRYDIVTITAVADDEPLLRLTLDMGASAANITSRYDGTALIAAAHLGHDGVVKTLIDAGAPLDHINNLGWTALIEAVILGDGGARHTDTVRALVTAGANITIADRQEMTPLDHARQRGYVGMIEILTADRGE
jgi:ankyrin repeat protein